MARFTLQQQRSRNENKLSTEKEIIFFMHQQGERKKKRLIWLKFKCRVRSAFLAQYVLPAIESFDTSESYNENCFSMKLRYRGVS
jgi:hypothetical protein